MSSLDGVSEAQMARLRPSFSRNHGVPRVDDGRVLSGIVFIDRNGLRWRDAPRGDGPHETRCNRSKRWSDRGVFARIVTGLAAEAPDDRTTSIDATCLKAHRTASSLRSEKGSVAV